MAEDAVSVDASLLANIRRHLVGLRRTADGELLYSLIERGLKRYGADPDRIEIAFLSFLHALLGRYVGDPASDPSTRFKAKVIQQHLAPLLPSEPPSRVFVPKPAASQPAYPPPGKRRDMEQLQEQLAHQVTEAISHNNTVDTLIKTSLSNLQQPNVAGNLDELKAMLIAGLEELIQGHKVVSDNLEKTKRYLKEVETDRRTLRDALSKARKSGMGDDLTGLPNKEVFLKQLDAEVARARRYGFDMALALIDVDGLRAINEEYGPEAGDLVLKYYAEKVMSQFRGYDMAARCGSDEFAVLLPNTQREGALGAIKKAQQGVAGQSFWHRNRDIAVPGFSCALIMYSPGETPETLMKRARNALDQAKRQPGQTLITV